MTDPEYPILEGVNMAVMTEQGKKDLIEWARLKKSGYTMLTVWERFNKTERKDIANWFSTHDYHVSPAQLAFISIKDVWGMLWHMGQSESTPYSAQNAALYYRKILVKAVEDQLKKDEERRNDTRLQDSRGTDTVDH